MPCPHRTPQPVAAGALPPATVPTSIDSFAAQVRVHPEPLQCLPLSAHFLLGCTYNTPQMQSLGQYAMDGHLDVEETFRTTGLDEPVH